MLDSETEARRQELLGNLEKEKDRLDGEIEGLRSFEREYRSRLKSYFSQQLQALDGAGEGGDAARPGRATRRSAAVRSGRGRQDDEPSEPARTAPHHGGPTATLPDPALRPGRR